MSEFKTNKAVFVGVILEKGGERKVQEYLDELAFLATTAGAIPDKMFTQRLDRPDKATYIGPGKLEEIKEYCQENEIEYVIFDDELTGMQQRNIEKVIACSDVIDRTSLILEIFAQRAKTSYAKMQVELAHYNYMLPRLAGMWTHLERQRGGMGTRGGMGETQIEIDRRIVKQRISKLKEDLKKVDKQMATQRGNRGSLVRLALVGYTNVGKSTLMNLLAKSDVFAENKLFATLGHRECSLPPERHRRIHPQAAHAAGGGLQEHPGRGEGGRCAGACGGHLPSGLRRADGGGGKDPSGDWCGQ